MKERSPAFQIYPRDFEGDENVKLMNLEELGAYMRLLFLCWTEGSIPADVDRIARILGLSADHAATIWNIVRTAFEQDVNDATRMRSPWLDREREKQRVWRERKVLAGKLSGEARRRKARNPKKIEHTSNRTRTEGEQKPNRNEHRCKLQTANCKQKTDTDSLRATDSVPESESKPGPDEVWGVVRAEYPPRSGKQGWKDGEARCRARLKEGASGDDVIAAVRRYRKWCEATGKVGTETVMQITTFFGTAFLENLLNPWEIPKRRNGRQTQIFDYSGANDDDEFKGFNR